MTELPSVTVIIPAFRASGTIGETLAALADQRDAPPFTVVVADNGCPEDTAAVAAAALDEHGLDGQVLDAGAEPGAAYARNFAASSVSTELVLFTDADDVVSTRWVSGHVAALADADLSSGPWQRWSPHAGEIARPDEIHATPQSFGPYPFVHGNNFGARRTTFLELGGLSRELASAYDVELGIRATKAGLRIGFAPEAGVLHRVDVDERAYLRRRFRYGLDDAVVRRLHDDYPAERVLSPLWRGLIRLPLLAVSTRRRRAWLPRMAQGAGYLVGRGRIRFAGLVGR
ncbi:MAG: glycosyltransferase [Actinomycetota bacterium]